jgi:hypothetical protein
MRTSASATMCARAAARAFASTLRQTTARPAGVSSSVSWRAGVEFLRARQGLATTLLASAV